MTNQEIFPNEYNTIIAPGSHWSLVVRKGMEMTLTDLEGGANVGMLFYNPNLMSEKYNAPDTLKCQHTFKLTRGHCLYSDMGRVFASITHDPFGWHDTICGNCHSAHVESRWGERNYQTQRNEWLQNGFDAFLVELAKYRMKKQDLAANLNLFSEVSSDDEGKLRLSRQSQAGDSITLRFEMDTLVVMHTCPHPLNTASDYPRKPVQVFLEKPVPCKRMTTV